MRAVSKALRWFVASCLSLVLLYCGIGLIMALVMAKDLPAFPFSWVTWLNRPNIPPVVDHVVNFLLTSMVATLFKDMWRNQAAGSRRRRQEPV